MVEVGWEVCWQLGGIYTVLRSKAPAMVEKWGNRYCMLGPYNHATASVEFEPLPREGYFGRAVALLEQQGIKAHYGRWLVSGEPRIVLLDFAQSMGRLGEFKYYLWRDHGIATRDEQEVSDVILFGYLVFEFFKALVQVLGQGDDSIALETGIEGAAPVFPVLAHFHEWMAGVPIPVINKHSLPVASIFTTHATLLGRYLAAGDPHFYEKLFHINPHKAAAERNIYPRFAIERAAAHGATVFTTISEITGVEAERFIERKPDILTPNGLNVQRFAAIHEFQNLHIQYKEKIHEFVMGHFFPYYNMDLSKTLYVFTAGRYEYRNKGIDLFIEGLARLNWRLKNEKKDINVVAFIITKAQTEGVNVEVLKNQMMLGEMRTVCNGISRGISRRLLEITAEGKTPRISDFLSEYDQLRLRRLTYAWKQGNRWPLAVTHDLVGEGADPVVKQLRTCQLLNQPENPVKIIYHPDFVSATSPIIGLDYDQFVRGCHLGVFPSYYEPWGYTPMECVAMGIPSVTSDLAGFGSYVIKNVEKHDEKGIFVVDRRYKSFHESADILVNAMWKTLTMSLRERVEMRNRVEGQSQHFDWRKMIEFYHAAHEMALERF